MINWGQVPAGSNIPFLFDTFAGSTGASITLTGLIGGDIEVYKGVSMTQRTATDGFQLLDTDGIDIDSRTGIHGVAVDTSINTDVGFYAADNFYHVIIDAVTIDSQTVRFVLGTFYLVPAVDVSDVHSLLTLVRSDTTIIHNSQFTVLEQNTSDTESMLVLIRSDTTHIESHTTRIHSDTITLASDLAEGDFSDILSRLTVTNSQLLIVKSDTSDIKSNLAAMVAAAGILSDINSGVNVIQSDTAVIETVTSDIQSDTNKLVSDATEVDTSDIMSKLTIVASQIVVVKSDTTHIESDAAAIEVIVSDIQSDTNKLVPAMATATDGISLLTQSSVIRENTVVTAAAGTITLDASAHGSNNFYNDTIIVITTGTAQGGGVPAGQARFITAYDGTTKVATISPDWTVTPTGGNIFAIIPFGELAGATAPTAAEVADAVWDEAQAGHVAAGSFGKQVSDVSSKTVQIYSDTTIIYSDTTTIQSDTTTLASDLAEGDFSDILSRLTVTNSQLLIVKSDTSDIKSALVIIASDTLHVESDTARIESKAVQIYSDTTIIASDTLHIESDAAAIETIVSDVQSDTNKLVSDATEVDTSDLMSRLTLVQTAVATATDGISLLTQSSVIRESAVVTATPTTVTLDASAHGSNDFYNNDLVLITSGSGQGGTTAGQARFISGYNGTTKVATVSPAWTITPTGGNIFTVLPFGNLFTEGDVSDVLSRLTVTNSQLLIVKSDTSDIKSALVIVASDTLHIESDAARIESKAVQIYSDTTIIYSDTTTIQSDTTTLASDLAEGDFSDILSRLTVTNSQLLIVKSDTSDIKSMQALIRSDTTHIESDAAAIETIVSDVQSDTNKLVSDATEVDTSDLMSRLTLVHSETTAIQIGVATATDGIAALVTDARTEPGQGAPAVNATAVSKIDYLYKAWRNQHTATAGLYRLYADDATTVDQKAVLSDDGVTFTRGEVVTGA